MIGDNFKHSEITGKVLKAFFNVYNVIGYGFAEKVYENALVIELKKLGLKSEKQKSINVFYNNEIVGSYFADLVVEDQVIVELKAVESLINQHEVQLVNYLRATNIEVGLLLNFGVEAQYKRRVLSNEFKAHKEQQIIRTS
jgi:GxxExxY protein